MGASADPAWKRSKDVRQRETSSRHWDDNRKMICQKTAMRAFPTLAILLAPFVASAAPGAAQAQEACTGRASPFRLIVHVENVRSAQGLIAVTLYADDARRFLAKRGSL